MIISEKKDLSEMSLTALFGKIQEHEMELDRLEIHELAHKKLDKHEGHEVKVRSLSLKTKYDSDQEEKS